jgi:hypothetical protein
LRGFSFCPLLQRVFYFQPTHKPVGFFMGARKMTIDLGTPQPAWLVMTLAILIPVAALAGFGTGWKVKDWKDKAQIALVSSEKDRLQIRNAVLVSENGQCKTDIESVRQSVAGIEKAADERLKNAEAEMTKAQKTAAWHVNRAAEIRNSVPPQPTETQCQALEREQIEYVTSRRASE